MIDCIVVGKGILGATIAESLRKHMEVLVIDCEYPMAGTSPSGGHLKPSWFGTMSKAEYEPAMELLDEIWGLTSDEFVIMGSLGLAKTKVYRVDTDKVTTKYTVGKVTEVLNIEGEPEIKVQRGTTSILKYRCKLLILATGVWAGAFDFGVECDPKQGVSFRMPGKLNKPFISPWAPYKQVVAHQQTENSIWVGDGSAILSKNWTDKRTEECKARCQRTLGKKLVAYRNNPPAPLEVRKGLRAYCTHPKSEPCLFKQVGPNIFLVTGAGKSGTIAAGFCARKILMHVGAL